MPFEGGGSAAAAKLLPPTLAIYSVAGLFIFAIVVFPAGVIWAHIRRGVGHSRACSCNPRRGRWHIIGRTASSCSLGGRRSLYLYTAPHAVNCLIWGALFFAIAPFILVPAGPSSTSRLFSGAPQVGTPSGMPLTGGRLPGQDPNLWVPLIAANFLGEP